MSNRKFAAITGSLLARKGEALPSAERSFVQPDIWRRPVAAQLPEMRAPVRQPEMVREMPVPQEPVAFDVAAGAGEATHRIAFRLTEAQHFRMRVAAAQMQVTRQAFLSAALDHYLATVCSAATPGCNCIGSQSGCGCAR